jgi:hypothetical protein
MHGVKTWRLWVMRAMYALIFVGQGILQTPRVIHHVSELQFSFWDGVATSFLVAMVLLAGIGIRYPLQMTVLLVYEMVWKAVWLLTVALPLWSAHRMDAGTLETLPSILMVVVVPFVIPWRYFFSTFAHRSGEVPRPG